MITEVLGTIGALAGVYGLYRLVKYVRQYQTVATALLDITTGDIDLKYDGSLEGYFFQCEDGTYLLRLFHVAPTGRREAIAHGIAKDHKVKICSFEKWAITTMAATAAGVLSDEYPVENYNIVDDRGNLVRKIFRIVEPNEDYDGVTVAAHGIADKDGLRVVDAGDWGSSGGLSAIAMNGNPRLEVIYEDEDSD